MRDAPDFYWISLLFVFIVAFVATCARDTVRDATAPAPVAPAMDLIGSESMRLLETDTVTDPRVVTAMRMISADVAECVGAETPDDELLFYITSGLFLRDDRGDWYPAYGVTIAPWNGHGRSAIYLSTHIIDEDGLRQVTPAEARVTLRHELIHWHAKVSHDPHNEEADALVNDLMAKCTNRNWRIFP